jgi:hypothetical protein
MGIPRLKRHKLTLLMLVAIGCGVPWGGAWAQNLLSIDPSTSSFTVGQSFQLSLEMNFVDPSSGGGVTVVYDPAVVSLDSIEVLAGDVDFQCPGSTVIACPGDPAFISFGDLAGLVGGTTVATLGWTAIGPGSSTIALAPASPFGEVGAGELAVVMTGAGVEIGAPGVPALSTGGFFLLVVALMVSVFARRRWSRGRLAVTLPLALLLCTLWAPPSSAQGAGDTDLDGIGDDVDNCTEVPNADQRDTNADGYGNLCDSDLDNDHDVDAADLALMKSVFFTSDPDADLDGDGTVNFLDLARMGGTFGALPGPTCSACLPAPPSGTFCGSAAGSGIAIPDDDLASATDSVVIAENITIADLNVSVGISHAWVGDLSVSLLHGETGTAIDLIDQVGVPASGFGCSGDDIDATLDDEATLPAEDECASGTPAVGGSLLPNVPLAAFDGENIGGTWTLTVKDLSGGVSGTLDAWCLLLNEPAPPVSPPVVGLTAYRPQSEAYGAPLQRRMVLEADEESPGAGIRINGDDDDGNLIPDRDDTSVTGENDLIEVELSANSDPAPAGYEYVLRRSNSSIKVWTSATKGTAILDANDEIILGPGMAVGSLWVENPGGGSALLVFEVRESAGGAIVSTDAILFFAFSGLVIGLHGEFQFPTDPVFGPNEGVSVLAVKLHEQGYDSHMYVENLVEADGSGAVYDEIVSAVQDRGVQNIAIYGFSHGGGSIYDLSERLDANKASIGAFNIAFTGYIDSIENDSDTDLAPEVRRPIGSGHHVNYYQSFGIIPPWGSAVPGADVNVNVTATFWGFLLVHITITNSGVVQDGIYDPLVLLVPR